MCLATRRKHVRPYLREFVCDYDRDNVRFRLQDFGRLYGQLRAMPATAILGKSLSPRVGGTPEPSVPVDLDRLDMLARARHLASPSSWSEDQIGHAPYEQTLALWAQDWAEILGHHSPKAEVGAQLVWLKDRLPWGFDNFVEVGNFVAWINKAVAEIKEKLGLRSYRKIYQGICKSCDQASTIVRESGDPYAICSFNDCGRLYSLDELEDWQKLVAWAERVKRPKAEISLLLMQRCPGCRHFLHEVPGVDEPGGPDGCDCEWSPFAAEQEPEAG